MGMGKYFWILIHVREYIIMLFWVALSQAIPTLICYNWDSPFSSQATSDRGGFFGV